MSDQDNVRKFSIYLLANALVEVSHLTHDTIAQF